MSATLDAPTSGPSRPVDQTTSGAHRAWNLPGLTGLRGIAVLAVVAYHLDYLPGGFVGVDLFFVLSGFLITSLLIRSTPVGAAGLATWWTRRFRRLTPAVAVVVLAVLVAFLTRSGIAMDALATMTWWQNWHLILEGTPYWAGTPSPLRHAWSLSIEEQFYLLWPLTLMGLLALGRRFRRPTVFVAGAAAAGAVASFAWAVVLSTDPAVSLSRIYFGTDTRAGALLAGCAVAAWMQRRPQRRIRPRRIRTPLTVASTVAAVVLVGLCIGLTPDQAITYRGGLALAALSALVLVAACTGPGPVTRVLAQEPLQWLGTRSYAIYLWSWPTQLFLQDHWPDLARAWIAVVTVAVSLVLADVSMRLVENPLRFRAGWASAAVPRRAAWSVGLVVLLLVGFVAAGSTVLTSTEKLAKEFERVPDPTTTVASGTRPSPLSPGVPLPASTTTTCVPTTAPAPEFSGDGAAFDPSTVNAVADPTGAGCGVTRVMVLGDSTGGGAANGLRRTAQGVLEVWDRTNHGCGMQTTKPGCEPWRELWPRVLDEVKPQVVLVHLGVSDDIVADPVPGFLSPAASTQRRQVLGEAMDLLRSGGARVVWVLPAVPLDKGLNYCDGHRRGTACDPAWIARWDEDVTAAAVPRGVEVVNLDAWIGEQGRTGVDRPDGVHLGGRTLDAEAGWLTQIIHGAG